MDYEKLYNELKVKHETLETTFENFKDTSTKDLEKLKKEYDEYKTTSSEEIDKFKKANIELYLQIPKKEQEEIKEPTPQETKVTCDDIINDLMGGN